MYSHSVSFAGGKMASTNGRAKDGGVTEEQLKAVEYELLRSKTIEQNDKRLAAVRATRASMQEDMVANQAPQNKRKAPSSAPVSVNEGCVLRSRVSKDQDHVDPEHQPSKEITHELDGDGSQKKGGRKITRKANIYARLNQPKIHIPLNGDGQPVGPDATEFANFIGTLVRNHIPPAELDWRDVDVEKKLLVWETLKAFYELDSTALSFVINTSHIKWKDWKSDLKRYKFDAALTDAQLMKRRDNRISEADWKTLITYWRSSAFENCANAVPHTSGKKSHARVANEMAVKLGHDPWRDEVYIETHTCKKGERKGSYVPQAETTINELIENAEKHPEWKEKSIQEGDLFARVCGMKEPRGRVCVLGLGPTPQDLGTPGTRGKLSTRVLVEMQGRREDENRYNMLQGHVQQMEERMNRMELMLASQGRHNLETPSS
uniref:Transposase, Ptta/En/Spm, plant n=1 Tax=Triticum urartu TaxID=4572 RepID=A0A8R7P824_TRIUA